MKKILIVLTIALSCLGINKVKAADLQLVSQERLDRFHEVFTDEEFSNIINTLINEYKEKYYYSHPYYAINLFHYPPNLHSDHGYFIFILFYYNEIPELVYDGGGDYGSYYTAFLRLNSSSSGSIFISYKSPADVDDNYMITDSLEYVPNMYNIFLINENSNPDLHEFYPIYFANFDLVLNSLNKFPDNSFLSKTYDNILVPNVSDSSTFTVLSLTSDNLNYNFKYSYDYDNKYNTDVFPTSFTEINLNDYAYVALALKDYNKKAFETTIYVKGQYCLTPVYNYGMTERKDILEGTQVDRCSPYYDNYTPIRTYILDNDLKNNAIYYLKSYDTTRDNYIKVDTSVFDVTYVTEENKDNPYVTIGGKTYPTIPYDNLTDTATKSEEEGYVSGAVEEFSFSDIFTAPMEFLEDIWDSIVSVFDLVKEFFSLLPEPIPTFLLSSFLLGLAIGLLKLIF